METLHSDDISVPVLDGRPYLGDVNVVDGLVTAFAQDVLRVRADFHSGKPGARNAVERIEELAAHYGNIVIGKNQAYQPAPWSARMDGKFRYHAPANLVKRFPNAPQTAFFIWIAQVVVACAVKVEEGKMTEQESAAAARETLDDVVARLVGAKRF